MPRARSATGELLRLLGDCQQPVYLLNSRRMVLYANPACAAWLECAADAIVGARCDYHSGTLTSDQQTLAAGLCPPPEAFVSTHATGIVTAATSAGVLKRRAAQFLTLQTPDEGEPATLAIVANHDLEGADEEPRAPLTERSSAEMHVLLRWLRQTIGARGVLDRWIGESPAVRRVRAQFQAALGSQARVVIVGPRGSGREDLARGLHYRPKPETYGPLIPIECPLVDAESLQTAVTSLARHKATLAPEQTASLLLIDVDQLSEGAQHELLGFLSVPGFDLRTLATSQVSLLALADRGQFQRDLAYALSTLMIELPTLSQRKAELPLIVQALVEEFNAAGGKQLAGCSAEALDRLATYSWPGDLAQLAETIHAACAHSAGPLLAASDLPAWLRLAEDAAAHPRRSDDTIVLDDFLADVERELIARALRRSRGNKAKAAKLLGISRPRLLRRIEQLGLAPTE